MADGTYRNYLQSVASGVYGLPAQEAQALLQKVGDDGRIDQGFSGNQRIAVHENNDPSAGLYGYGAGDGYNSLNDKYRTLYSSRNPGQVLGESTGGASRSAGSPDDISFLNDQEAQLRSLLGRTDTGLNQGLTRLEDDYQTQVGSQNKAKDQALQGYGDQRIDTNKAKQSTYDTINNNAGNGFRSLAQIIGRASGTGSSAFRELLPDVIGKDTSSKRRQATDTYGQNLQSIDKAQQKTEVSFADILAQLAKQRKSGEEDLRGGIEGQRQSLLGQISGVQGRRAQAQGGGYAAVKAAQAPTQQAIDSSRNSVESFFNQFRTPYTQQNASIATPELSKYTADRSSINAQGQPGVDPSNPYAALLRKRLQGGMA